MNNYNNVNPTPLEIRKTLLSLPTDIDQNLNQDETLEDIEIELKREYAKTIDSAAKKSIETDLKRIAILIKQQKIVDVEMQNATRIKKYPEKVIENSKDGLEVVVESEADKLKEKQKKGYKDDRAPFDRGERIR